MEPSERDARIASLSRELAVVCSTAGEITWADGRAVRMLGPCVGKLLRDVAAPGTEAKVDDLLRQAAEVEVGRFEVCLVASSRATTLAFRALPTDGGILLVGAVVTDDEAATFGNVAASLAELGELHRETARQRRELLDSNRALLALHAEIDEKNDALRKASDVKSRVVANVSHELRTPINSILGLTQLLLDRIDGDLTSEQEKQLRFVRTSAEGLSELVDDILDLSRIEAGRHEIRAAKTSVSELLSSLRGMLRPLAKNPDVALVVDEPADGTPSLDTDTGKIAQILRNLTSNALKFTERGEVRVRAAGAPGGRVRFEVSDTGIGIAPEDQARVFEEFTQIDGAVQRKVRGTGLGLSLSRRLAELLGGSLTLTSRVGEGSTFTLEIPAVHEEVAAVVEIAKRGEVVDPSRAQVLVVEDNRQTLFMYEKYLSAHGFQVIPARSLDEARRALERVVPAAVVLDVVLEGEATWGFLGELKESARTRDVPVMVVTVVDRAQKARALGADEFWLKPVDGERLIRKLAELSRRGPVARVLVIDDDEPARYLVRKLLAGAPYAVFEAGTAAEGVRLAKLHKPEVILLDFVLGEQTAFDVIDDLKADAETRCIPVILQTARTLDEAQRARLERETSAILEKQSLSRELAITRIREALVQAGVRPRDARTT